MGADTVLFVGAHYEIKNGSEITKYYMAGSTRIAMRKYTIPQNMTVEYLLSDHLGSTSLTTDASGAKVSEIRYKAWGEIRASWTSSPSTTPAYRSPAYTFTGQFSYMDDPTTSGVTEGFGLMFYNARWYDGALGRFAQADTVVPGRVQGLDRYAYTNNNPVKYVDPTGHTASQDDGGESQAEHQHCDLDCIRARRDDQSDNTVHNIIQNPATNKPPCERVFEASTCQTTSKLLGIGVIVLDMTSLGLSATGVILELIGTAGGPEGLAAAIGTYATTLNPIENTLGGMSLSVSAFNDFFITGESYINLDNTYQGTPSIELVLGSDTSVGIVASTLGLSPEGITDSIINGGAVAYDAYRLSGGKQLVQTHIILTANLNLHLDFRYLYSVITTMDKRRVKGNWSRKAAILRTFGV